MGSISGLMSSSVPGVFRFPNLVIRYWVVAKLFPASALRFTRCCPLCNNLFVVYQMIDYFGSAVPMECVAALLIIFCLQAPWGNFGFGSTTHTFQRFLWYISTSLYCTIFVAHTRSSGCWLFELPVAPENIGLCRIIS